MKINAQLKKIIYELSKDARQPASHIAKKARVSKDVAFYNIKNLMNKAIITKLITLINTESLGYQRYELFIQLSDFSVEKELIQNLTNHQMFLWVRRSLGEWDVLSEFYSKNNVQAEKILNNLKTEYGQQIKKTSLSIVMKEHSFPLRLLGYNEKETIFCDEQKKEAQIDKEDRIILKYLSNNARIPVTEIAPNSSLSTDAIIYRIKKLIKNKIILGYRAVIDEKKLG
ncbi:MAG: AsnC family transcriptional regulator, partial [Nanoarchaeota archaeon]|nr:AsnC family transcriptional regulator [Nanoarchaeota archaeon]